MVTKRNEVIRTGRRGPRSSWSAKIRAAGMHVRARGGASHGGAISTERIEPGRLPAHERRELSERLYEVHSQIFGGVDWQEFDGYVVNSPAVHTTLWLYRNDEGDVVGYFAIHRFEKRVEGRHLVVYRSEIGFLPAYRHKQARQTLLLARATRFKLRHPWRRVYLLSCPVSPSAYAIAAKYTHKVYPRYDRATPADVLRLMTNLAEQFGLDQVYPSDPLVRRVGWKTKPTPAERQFWEASTNPHLRFYLARNPRFSEEGNGLLTLIPFSISNGVLLILGYELRRLRKAIRAAS